MAWSIARRVENVKRLLFERSNRQEIPLEELCGLLLVHLLLNY